MVDSGEDKVWASVTYTVNLGNYENVKIDGGTSRSIGPDDDPEDLRKKRIRRALKNVMSIGEEVRRNRSNFGCEG